MPKKILLVDDDAGEHLVIVPILSKAGYTVISAKNGEQALQLVFPERPDLIILDFTMPVMNGLEAAKTLRSMMPEVPLILFTVHRSANLDSDASVAGINAVISKVEGVTALIDRVRSLLLEPA